LREKAWVAAFLKPHLAGLKTGPVAAELTPPSKTNRHLGKLRLEEGRKLLMTGGGFG
jgi:hypothetical protein